MKDQTLIWRLPGHFGLRLLFLGVSLLIVPTGIDAIEHVSIDGKVVLRDQRGRTVDNDARLEVIVFYYAGNSRLSGNQKFAIGPGGAFSIQVPLEATHPLKKEVTRVERCRFVCRRTTGYWLDREVVLAEDGQDIRVLLEAVAKLDLVGSFSLAGADKHNLDTVPIRIEDLGTGKASYVQVNLTPQNEFRLAGVLVPGRRYRVTASLLGFRKSTVVFEGCPRIGPVECGEIELEPAGTIAGKVLLGGDVPRNKVQHALVLEGVGHDFRVHHPLVPGGTFEFRQLPLGRYRLLLEAPTDTGLWKGRLDGLEVTPQQLELKGIELAARKVSRPVKAPSREKGGGKKVTLSGTVIGPDGKPVAGAIVEIFSGTDLQRVGFAPTGRKGYFSTKVPPGQYRVRAAPIKRGEEMGMSWVEVALEQDVEVVIKLPSIYVFPCVLKIPEKFRPIEAVSLTRPVDRKTISVRSIFQDALFVSRIDGGRCKVAARKPGQNQVAVLAALGDNVGAFLVDVDLAAGEDIMLSLASREFILLE